MIDITKHLRSTVGVNRWFNTGIGTLNYVTGFGKTRTGLLIIRRLLDERPNSKILIVGPSITVCNTWIEAVTKPDDYFSFSPKELTSNISIYSASTLLNCTEEFSVNWDLVIIDEIHKFTTPDRYSLFTKLDYRRILGLTGTYPIGLKKAMLRAYCPIVDTITEEEALAKGWISNFREYNIRCVLTEEDKFKYEKFTAPIHETLELFNRLHKRFIRTDGTLLIKDDYQLIQACKSGLRTKDNLGSPIYLSADSIRQTCAYFMGWSNTLDLSDSFNRQRDDLWNPDHIKQRVAVCTDFVEKRQNIIINNDVKLRKVVEIFKEFRGTTICFNESTEFADKVAKAINEELGDEKSLAVVYHSNMESRPLWDDDIKDYIRYGSGAKAGEIKIFGKGTLRKIAVNGLAAGYYKFLSTARAMDEGLDIPCIDQVITTAGTANPIQYAQRGGRGKRIDVYNPNKITKIFNLYFDDFIGTNGNIIKSRDKQKLIAKQQERGSTVIWIDELSDILSD